METKRVIFNTSGSSPKLGNFTKDEIREAPAAEADIQIMRGICSPDSRVGIAHQDSMAVTDSKAGTARHEEVKDNA